MADNEITRIYKMATGSTPKTEKEAITYLRKIGVLPRQGKKRC